MDELLASYVVIDQSKRKLLDSIAQTLRPVRAGSTLSGAGGGGGGVGLDLAKKETLLLTLMSMLGDPDLADDVHKCLNYYGQVDDVGERLFGLLHDTENPLRAQEAANGARMIIRILHLLSSQFVEAFNSSIIPKIQADIKSSNIRQRMELLCDLMQAQPNICSRYNLRFVGAHHFSLGVELGKGKFGIVFKGVNKLDGTPVAIKKIDRAALLAGVRPEQAKNLQRLIRNEMDVMQHMAHEYTVELLEIEDKDGCTYLVTEFMAGGDFKQYLKMQGVLSEAEATRWLKQLAIGLQFMRSKNIVHRDLKPDNLLLTSKDTGAKLKLADFGLARFLSADSVAETHVGTPLYMAPEVFETQPYTEKADLWSVGVITYEMLTGSLPYTAKNLPDLKRNLRTQEIVLPQTLSADLKDLLLRLLQRNADQRISWNDFFSHPVIGLTKEGVPTSDEAETNIMLLEKEQRIKELENDFAQLREKAGREIMLLTKQINQTEMEKEKLKHELSIAQSADKELRSELIELREFRIANDLQQKDSISASQAQNEKAKLQAENSSLVSSTERLKGELAQAQQNTAQIRDQLLALTKEKDTLQAQLAHSSQQKPSQLFGFSVSLNTKHHEVYYKDKKGYPLEVDRLQFLDAQNFTVYFIAKGDGTEGEVPWVPTAAKLVIMASHGRTEPCEEALGYDSDLSIKEPEVLQGRISFHVPHFMAQRTYAFDYHTGYAPIPLFNVP
eukprot:TRINITY_DN1570_c1_g1_i1.p1 TRINITY_DN1570_c1_g1~~TRINITY_DN1570_c1_g1_i1.p1  ORF type:complete len:728 (+),score=113.17 TRINITY_DN1570_c1_g1_i1:175-2358(+)